MRLIVPLLVGLAAAGCATGPGAAGPGWIVAPGVEAVLQEEEVDCGAAALASVFNYWEIPNSLDELRESCALGPAGIAAAELRDAARERGLEAYLIRAGWDDLVHELSRGRPVLAGVVRSGRAHYVVVSGLNAGRGRILLVDPAGGRSEQARSRFEADWSAAANLALVVFRREEGR